MRVGVTPYVHTDSKILLSTTHLALEKEGYLPLETLIVKNEDVDVGAIVGGIFIWPLWLWAMKYYPERTYELMPLGYYDYIEYEDTYYEEDHKKSPTIDHETKYKLLWELKKLHDEGVLTDDEYQKEKSRILNQGKE